MPSGTAFGGAVGQKASEFSIISGFKSGYRNREDKTVLPPGILVQGSQNVLTNTFNRVGIRRGFTLDGQADTAIAPILSSFDWERHTGNTRHLRGGFNTTGTNAQLQYRYVANAGDSWDGNVFTQDQVYWIPLVQNENNALFRFCDFWDFDNELKDLLLFVNGKSQIWEWSGGVTTLKSSSNAAGVIQTFDQPGVVLTASITSGGAGYLVGDIIRLTTGGNNAAINVTGATVFPSFPPGVITSITVASGGTGYATGAGQPAVGGHGDSATINVTSVSSNAGTGYTIGDVLTAVGGGNNATFRVADVSSTGQITSLTLLTPGSGYSVATVNLSGGSGASATLNITAIAQGYIEKNGTTSWAEEGFYNLEGGRAVVINNNIYTYTGGETTTFITGISPDPTGEAIGSVIHQNPVITINAQTEGLPIEFSNVLIANLKNQIYIGGSENQSVYVSQTNNYKDYTFSTPVRSPGEGAILTLDAVPTALSPQKEQMYISAGQDQWYLTQFQLSGDLSSESLNIERLKTTSLQGTQSQELLTKIKNNLCFVSFEPIVNILGTAQNYLNDPQTQDLSYSIVNDMNTYNFGDGSIAYHKQFVYLAVPKQGIVLIYNMTDPEHPYWEAPQILPISRFSVVDGELYGHSYQVGETYKLFNGFNDNGAPIAAAAVFSFNNHGTPSYPKNFTRYYVEGYISSNTELALGIQYDVDGCGTIKETTILGTDKRIVCLNTGDNSLGKKSFGKFPLGGNLTLQSSLDTPPKFRVVKTFSPTSFYEEQTGFFSDSIDARWEILRFGAAAYPASEGNNAITE